MTHRSAWATSLMAGCVFTAISCSDNSPVSHSDLSGEPTSALRAPLGPDLVEVVIAFKRGYGSNEKRSLATVTSRAPHYEFSGFPAVAIRVPRNTVAALRASPLVRRVDEGLPLVALQSVNNEVIGWHFRLNPDGHGFSEVPARPACPNPINGCPLNNVNGNGSGVGVGIIDTGIDCSVRDFFRPCAGGVDFTGENTPFRDVRPHGTLLASLVKATGGSPGGVGAENGGIKGIAPSANVYSLRIFDSNNQGTCLRSAQAIDYVTFNLPSVSIINTSYGIAATTAAQRAGYESNCQAEKTAVANAVARKLFIAAAAGNVSQLGDSVAYPARLPGVMAVSGLNTPVTGACPTFGVPSCKTFFWTGSSRGSQVGIAAAAAQVTAIRPNNSLTTESGTSLAAPIVAGTAAAISARYGLGRRADCLIPHLKRFAYRPQGYTAVQYGAGVLDARAAWNTSPLTSCP
jgi:subtilisin family serine protease